MKLSPNNYKLITFSGIDGAGKTTLSKYLVEDMESKGIQFKHVYGRIQPFLLKPFINVGQKLFLKGDMFENYEDYSATKREAIHNNSILFTFYRRILWLDYFLQLLFKIRIPLMFGKRIICDRYVYDTVITDLSIDMNYSHKEVNDLIKKSFNITPEPDLAFLIKLREKVAYQRKDDTPSVKYLKERNELYSYIGDEFDMIVLDGSKSLDDLKFEIEKVVFDE